MLNNFLFHHPFASLIRDAEETSEMLNNRGRWCLMTLF